MMIGQPGWAAYAMPRSLQRALNGLFVASLVLTLAVVMGSGAPVSGRDASIVAALSVLLAATYTVGFVGPARRAGSRRREVPVPSVGTARVNPGRALRWLGTMTVVWACLMAFSAGFSWLGFPLFALYVQLLPLRLAIPAVALGTAVVVTAKEAQAGGLEVSQVAGPVLGALIATLTVLGYQSLHRESQARQALIHELVVTRDALADSQREAGRLAERQRLAREIHDTVAQGLSSVIMLLRSTDAVLPPDASLARERAAQAIEVATANLDECRRFLYELSPPPLDETPLPEALRRLVDRSASDGLGTAFHLHGEPYPLGAESDVALLRLTQEALANVRGHAHAATCVVSLCYLDGRVTLDVFDDGKGFDPELPPQDSRSGFGLHGMRQRIEGLGGALTVESAIGEGTAVAASLPMPLGGTS
ncbi:sensor histidine kinase [Streptomyces sp. NPDC057580]|uniref:sensor histidine kinase n=1 Tax=Streptomyces sp. NPDC057580 TaxID=3346173 RepID=UPI00368798B2